MFSAKLLYQQCSVNLFLWA